jgi:hypothetical protein
VLAYASQFHAAAREKSSKVWLPLDQLEQRMNLYARRYGHMIGVQYAEGFVVKEIFAVDDVVRMPVRSM